MTHRLTARFPRQGLSRRHLLERSVVLAASLLPVAGCGSGEPTYYTLTPSPGAPQVGGPLTVEVRTPSIAGTLDRDHIVRRNTAHGLVLADDGVWAGPLAEMIGSTLTLDLGQRLPGSNVYSQSGAISTQALALVELDVSGFMEDSKGRAEITATLSVHRPESGPTGSRSLNLARMPADGSVGALVGAFSELLGEVAGVAASELRALSPANVSGSS